MVSNPSSRSASAACAAVVELDALADAVRTAAQHHDLLAVGGRGFALFLVGRIHVGRAGGELGGAGVHALVHGTHVELVTQLAHLGLGRIQQEGQAAVREAATLQFPQGGVIQVGQRLLLERQFDVDDFLDLRQEPRVDVRDVVHFVQREALGEGVAHVPDALGAGLAQLDLQLLAVGGLLVQAIHADFQPAQLNWNDSWKVRPMAMTSPTDFIWVVRRASAVGNFSNAKRGTLVTT